MAPLAAAAATSGAEDVEAADVVTGNGGLRIDLRASLTAELSDANAAASGGGCGCCRCGLLESCDIGDSNRDRRQERKRAKPPCSLVALFHSGKKKMISVFFFDLFFLSFSTPKKPRRRGGHSALALSRAHAR